MRPYLWSLPRGTWALALTILLTAIQGPYSAAQDKATSAERPREGLKLYCLDNDGLAIQGYSPVSYFDKRKAEKGNPEFAVTHRGVTYHFTDAKQVEEFKANPDKYEPAHGGWCALMMAGSGNRVAANPESFKIVGGKLLLFFHGKVKGKTVDGRANWQKRGNQRGQLRKADKTWSQIEAGKRPSKIRTF